MKNVVICAPNNPISMNLLEKQVNTRDTGKEVTLQRTQLTHNDWDSDTLFANTNEERMRDVELNLSQCIRSNVAVTLLWHALGEVSIRVCDFGWCCLSSFHSIVSCVCLCVFSFLEMFQLIFGATSFDFCFDCSILLWINMTSLAEKRIYANNVLLNTFAIFI